jgi:hypothetical protein
MIQLKQIVVPFIECCVMSFIWILVVYPFKEIINGLSLFVKLLGRESVHIGLLEEMNVYGSLFIVSFLGFSIIIYIIVKMKYNLRIKEFFYGIGFTFCCVLLFLSLERILGEAKLWILLLDVPRVTFTTYTFSALSFILFYYTYVTLLKNDKSILLQNDKKISKDTLYLAVLTIISYAILITFEIIHGNVPVFGMSLLFFGSYFVSCLSFEKMRISPRQMAWIIFISAHILVFIGYASRPF